MAYDYTEYDTLNAVGIVKACLAANKPERIIPALLDHRSAASIEAELLAAATTPAPAVAASTNDSLRDVIEKRFRAQNRRAG
jgi:hypothetical protein